MGWYHDNVRVPIHQHYVKQSKVKGLRGKSLVLFFLARRYALSELYLWLSWLKVKACGRLLLAWMLGADKYE